MHARAFALRGWLGSVLGSGLEHGVDGRSLNASGGFNLSRSGATEGGGRRSCGWSSSFPRRRLPSTRATSCMSTAPGSSSRTTSAKRRFVIERLKRAVRRGAPTLQPLDALEDWAWASPLGQRPLGWPHREARVDTRRCIVVGAADGHAGACLFGANFSPHLISENQEEALQGPPQRPRGHRGNPAVYPGSSENPYRPLHVTIRSIRIGLQSRRVLS